MEVYYDGEYYDISLQNFTDDLTTEEIEQLSYKYDLNFTYVDEEEKDKKYKDRLLFAKLSTPGKVEVDPTTTTKNELNQRGMLD